MKNLIVASTSTVHGSGYLDYLFPELSKLYDNVPEVVFIPYAQPSGMNYDDYTALAKKAFSSIGIAIKGIHEFKNPQEALKEAKGLFVGGGNTFLLVSTLYKFNLMALLKTLIEKGVPYLGTSAGSNICGLTMQTTNDMPIVYPPSFTTLGVVPFNINPHYLDPDPDSTHKGETRETRIAEYHGFNTTAVLGLREGSWLAVKGRSIILKGPLQACLFIKDKKPKEIPAQTDINRYL
ncbi:MAG: dipeptidase PepE [Flavobacteriaceae bacterium]|nr:dipeptidase PepE [Flavobacteriaceae bacterium]